MAGDESFGVIAVPDPLPAPDAFHPAPEKIVAGDPAQRVWILRTSPDGRYTAGLWEGEPGTWRVRYTEEETCHLLSGTVVLTAEDGRARTFRAGDSFIVEAGFTGTWQVLERARKLFAVYEPG